MKIVDLLKFHLAINFLSIIKVSVLNWIPGTIANKLLDQLTHGTQNEDPDCEHISHISQHQMPMTMKSMVARIEKSK